MDIYAARKAKHERKRKAERKLMRKLGYGSTAFISRKQVIIDRVAKKEAIAHARSLKRKKEKKIIEKTMLESVGT